MKNLSTLGRAAHINQDTSIYGAFAEIGAGQEVARFFFQAGKASQTIAKTMSAYDMIYSDEIYGKEASGRYVCESRLKKMLDKEYSLLHQRLDETRGKSTTFFAFANTVATGSQGKRHCHGWMGVRFQKTPMGPYNDIVMHVRMLDRHRLQQQESLGVLGVNLVYTAFYQTQASHVVASLIENLKPGQVVIDMLRVNGPDLDHLSNHLLNLELVRRNLCDAALFGPDQSILEISESVFNRPIIVERGSFRPVTLSHLDLLEKGLNKFKVAFPKEDQSPLVLFEMTMNSLQSEGKISEEDFLDRVRTLTSLGHHVLVSNFFLFYRLKRYLRSYTSKPMAMIVGASLLERLFDEQFYKDLEGGLLEGLGKLMDDSTSVFVYPSKQADLCMTCASFHPKKSVAHIYRHFLEHGWLSDMADCEQIEEFVNSKEIISMIKKKNAQWEKLVPPKVRDLIKKEKLFGY